MTKVHFGEYQGQEWSSVPESYLFFVVNKSDSPFAKDCRREVVRRYTLRGSKDPWLEKKGPLV